jgi:hypothetical protein
LGKAWPDYTRKPGYRPKHQSKKNATRELHLKFLVCWFYIPNLLEIVLGMEFLFTKTQVVFALKYEAEQ